MDDLDMLQEDINLDDIADIDLDAKGNTLPAKTGLIALVDADTIAYTACLNTEVKNELLGKDFYTDEEWEAIIASPNYDSVEEALWEINPLAALANADTKIQRILDITGCNSVELHFSAGKENFRYSVLDSYKANRTGRSPAGLMELKENLCKKYNGTIHTAYEADDIVVYKRKTFPDKYVMCAVDKDVLNSIAGKHFNYYESFVHNKEMSWVEIDRYTSIVWPFLQTLMGDRADNIIGLKGIGPAKALQLLHGYMTIKDLWDATVRAYVSKGRTPEEALINMNLVNMHLLQETDNGLEIVLLTKEAFND